MYREYRNLSKRTAGEEKREREKMCPDRKASEKEVLTKREKNCRKEK